MNIPRQCPKCGSTLAPDAPEGLCPACLMAGALPTDATIKLTPSQMRTPSHGPVTPEPEELAPLFPQLEIIELLGRGGMGAVYKARQPKLNRFVALKIIAGDAAADAHFAERFQREAQALAKLNHPNIVSVFDFGMVGCLLPQAPPDAAERRTEDSPPHLYYFLMEFVDGANLRTMMQSGEMKPEAALALIPAFCDALQYAHDEGVVHRDIKPENVLVDKKGRVKIADFGLAKLTGSEAHDHTLTRTGMYLGTPRYMAPEQVEKPDTVDHRADIYSLGVVFYEMLTGELPMGRFDPPSKKVQVDVKLDDIVLRSLEKEPARRYQHASEIKTDVQSVAGMAPAAASSPLSANPNAASSSDARLSRMALIGAIWAFFGLIAVIPAVLLTKTVEFSQGESSSHVHEQPPVAFTVFMGVLLFIGMAAPLGTTILGAISMSNIKKPGGKLYGLPLAFADTILFPLLLVHGAMAVMLGLLILTLMKLAGVNAALGALEIGLLAMLPLLADFFIVRALWRKLAGWYKASAAPATPPAAAMKPRKRHLLTTGLVLLFFTAFIFGIDFRGSSLMTAGGRDTNVTVGAFDPWFVYAGTAQGFHHHVQPFSWSFFALVVAGITFGALWRVGREDDGKVPRDPAWWRDWWKQVCIWGGLLLIACVVRTVRDAQRGQMPASSSAPPISVGKPATQEIKPEGVPKEQEQVAMAQTPAQQAKSTGVKPALSAASSLLRQVSEKYGALSTLSVTGRTIAEVADAGSGAPSKLESTFSINLARPEFYRIEWKQPLQGSVANQGAVWSSGSGHRVLMGGKVSEWLDRAQALGAATGVSGGAANTLPGLFFKGEGSGLHELISNAAFLPDEIVGGEACQVIAGNGPGGKLTIWITRKDSYLKQVRTAASGGGTAQAGATVSSEAMTKIAKTLGTDATPEGVSKMTREIEAQQKRVAGMSITITEIFEHVVANDLMIKEDFKVVVPAGGGPATQ